MTWLFVVSIISWLATWYFLGAADRPGDDFGAAFPFLLFCGLSVVLTGTYVALVFWNHRFL